MVTMSFFFFFNLVELRDEVVNRTLDTGSFQGKQKKQFECHGTRGGVDMHAAHWRFAHGTDFWYFSCCIWCI